MANEEAMPLKFPMSDISPSAKEAAYIAVLERKVQYQTTLLLQYRALFEALTGDKWEEVNTQLSAGDMRKVARNSFERNLARDLKKAEAAVEANLARANETDA